MFEIFEGVLNKYSGNDKVVEIPSTVTSLGDMAFYDCASVEKVIIGDHVSSIGNFCFYGCENLKEVVISDNCQMMGAGCFSSCFQLTEVTLPKTLRTLGRSIFYKCKKLKQITLPGTIQTIDKGAFGFCESLEEIVLPQALKSIGDEAFANCLHLKAIELPRGVKTLGTKVFLNCSQLRKIVLSESLESVGLACFQTYGQMELVANDTLELKPKMFDEYYMFNVASKNKDNYMFTNSYIPCVDFKDWKPVARLMLLVNFFETYDMHSNKENYLQLLNDLKDEVVSYCIKEKRFDALNQGLQLELINSMDVEPYFEFITDREQKAKIMEYKNKETKNNSSFDDLDSLLDDLF